MLTLIVLMPHDLSQGLANDGRLLRLTDYGFEVKDRG